MYPDTHSPIPLDQPIPFELGPDGPPTLLDEEQLIAILATLHYVLAPIRGGDRSPELSVGFARTILELSRR